MIIGEEPLCWSCAEVCCYCAADKKCQCCVNTKRFELINNWYCLLSWPHVGWCLQIIFKLFILTFQQCSAQWVGREGGVKTKTLQTLKLINRFLLRHFWLVSMLMRSSPEFSHFPHILMQLKIERIHMTLPTLEHTHLHSSGVETTTQFHFFLHPTLRNRSKNKTTLWVSSLKYSQWVYFDKWTFRDKERRFSSIWNVPINNGWSTLMFPWGQSKKCRSG